MQKLLANSSAKISKYLVKKLNLGQGSALPGRVALALDPSFVRSYNESLKQGDYGFFVSGTNGKTTSSGLLANIIKVATGEEPVNNSFGANLYYGIASELVNSSKLNSELKSTNFVFEVDEAALRLVSKDLETKAIVLTNIFRDQLDRFGEIDATQKLLLEGLEKHKNKGIKLFLNANDKKISELKELLPEASFDIKFYKVENVDIALSESKASKVDVELFKAELLERRIDSSLIKLSYGNESQELLLPIAGDFNIHNACAAAAAAFHSGISWQAIKEGIETYSSVFGRGEKIQYKVGESSKELNIFLIKNPAGCTEVINFVSQFPSSRVLIAINDNYADGRDVSWLWDALFENFADEKLALSFTCAGSRAYDMALRLKYAGVDTSRIEILGADLARAIDSFAKSSNKDEKLFVLPTYTALLEINKIT